MTDMANAPKKIKDPTEAALSAIQDALSIRDAPPDPVRDSAAEVEHDSLSPPDMTSATQHEDALSDPPWR
ncbi:MAG: hypothetical protein E6G96_21080, partial [Alphaproteobacteria bacterium]